MQAVDAGYVMRAWPESNAEAYLVALFADLLVLRRQQIVLCTRVQTFSASAESLWPGRNACSRSNIGTSIRIAPVGPDERMMRHMQRTVRTATHQTHCYTSNRLKDADESFNTCEGQFHEPNRLLVLRRCDHACHAVLPRTTPSHVFIPLAGATTLQRDLKSVACRQ